MAQGAYKIWPVDEAGDFVGDPTPPEGQPVKPPDPADEKATDIYFGVPETAPQPLPRDQSELQQDIAEVLRTVQQLYLQPTEGSNVRSSSQFRKYYVRLFRLAQLGLEGANVSPEISQSALVAIRGNLIDDEAGRIKNDHLKQLGMTALKMALPFILLYLILRLTPSDSLLARVFLAIGIESVMLANFMMLWVGCFLGVWLSYGIRTSEFSIEDLTVTDDDRLQPAIRLLFAGTLTMILGIVFVLGLIQVSVGNFSLTDFSANPMLGFLVGTFCGVSELLLPSTVGKQATEFIGKMNKP